ncbi:hypothetical protein R3P38DRAFT_2798726 [Favolaschia claudopus]|uniref:Uncharacterized protein n=1 Tax=Favolaschia claudopus TaxID=2862362 RepID=A0AAW0A124_9AGAR
MLFGVDCPTPSLLPPSTQTSYDTGHRNSAAIATMRLSSQRNALLLCSGTVWRQKTRGKDIEYLWTRLHETLEQSAYAILLNDWLCFCLGADITVHLPEDALKECQQLFLHVLYLRYQHNGQRNGDREAKKLLDEAQMESFHRYVEHLDLDVNIPADYSWEADMEAEAEESSEDLDPDYVPDQEVVAYGEEPPKFVEHPPPPSNFPHHLHTPSAVDEESELLARASAWALNICRFFFPPEIDTSLSLQKEHDSRPIVDDLVQMRAVESSVYKSDAFKDAQSNLFALMRRVARPGNPLETIRQDVEQSFRFHAWKIAYAELICDWVEPTVSAAEYEKLYHQSLSFMRPNPSYKFTIDDAGDFLQFILDHPETQPWSFNPMAVYLFMSLQCFQANCSLWLVPALRQLNYTHIDGWNPVKVYQMIMQLPVFAGEEQALVDFAHRSQDRRLYTIIRETSEHRRFLRDLDNELYRPSPRDLSNNSVDCDLDSEFDSTTSAISDSEDDISDFDAAATSHAHQPRLAAGGRLTRSQRRKAYTRVNKQAERRGQRGHVGRRVKQEVMGTPGPQLTPHS